MVNSTGLVLVPPSCFCTQRSYMRQARASFLAYRASHRSAFRCRRWSAGMLQSEK